MSAATLKKFLPDTLVNMGVTSTDLSFLNEFNRIGKGLGAIDQQALNDGKIYNQRSTGMEATYTTRGGVVADAGSPSTEQKIVDNQTISNTFDVPVEDIQRGGDIVGEHANTLAERMAEKVVTDLYAGNGSTEFNSFRSLVSTGQSQTGTAIDPSDKTFFGYLDEAIGQMSDADLIIMPFETHNKYRELLREGFGGNESTMIEGMYATVYNGVPVVQCRFPKPYEDIDGVGYDSTASDGTTYKYQSVYVIRRSMGIDDDNGLCYTHPTLDTNNGKFTVKWNPTGYAVNGSGQLLASQRYIMHLTMNMFLKDERSLSRIAGVQVVA